MDVTKSKTAAGVGAALGMLLLILDGKTAFNGAAEGVSLCFRTVIPSLFPFFILSALLTGSFLGTSLPISAGIFGVPGGAESLLLAGFLGGYPVGAQNIATVYRNGQLSREQAERMLGFCNNAGPSFLFGMIAPMFPNMKYPWLLWAIHILSALMVGILLPKAESQPISLSPGKDLSLPDALWQAIRVMASVCGWIVLFRVGIAFLDRWILWMLPAEWQVLVTGLLELSNGCCALPQIEDVNLRFLICSGMLAFGGLCVTMQTVSVTQNLSLRFYFLGKIMQAAVSVFLAWLVLPKGSISSLIPVCALGVFVVLTAFLRKTQNNSSIPRLVGV